MKKNRRVSSTWVPFAFLLFFFVLTGIPCQAHGLAIFLSTPFTPPLGYSTYQLLSYASFFLLISFILWQTWEMKLVGPWIAGAYTMVLFYQLFFFFDKILVPNSTAPEPGLGSPNPVFPGLSWQDVGRDFLFWNGLGCALLALLIVLVGGAWKEMKDRKLQLMLTASGILLYTGLWSLFFQKHDVDLAMVFLLIIFISLLLVRTTRVRVIYFFSWIVFFNLPHPHFLTTIANLFIFLFPIASFAMPYFHLPEKNRVTTTILVILIGYALIVSPLIMNRALSHGWEGSYFRSSCKDRLMLFASLLNDYAANHGGNLPQAQTMKDLVRVLQPLIEEPVWPFPSRLEFCPRTIPYSIEPTSYVWIASFSGMSLEDVSHFPIECREHKDWKESEIFLLEEMGIKEGINRKTKEKFAEALRQAERGDPVAQCAVGKAYIQERGVPSDYEKAMHWLKKSAATENAEAQYFLAKLFHFGWGVQLNYEIAREWYLKAAEKGHDGAKSEIRCMYECGVGIPKNLSQAYFWADENYRARLAKEMTPEQIREGERLILQKKEDPPK